MEPASQTDQTDPAISSFLSGPSVNLTEGFRNLTESIAAKHTSGGPGEQSTKRRKGRQPFPRDEQGNIVRPSEVKEPGQTVPGATISASPVPPIDLQLIEDSVKALLQTIDATIKQSVKESAFTLTQSKPMAENLENKVSLQKVELESMAKLSALCCQQYQLVGQHAPALFLGVFAVGYTVRVAFVLRALRSIARQLEQQKANRESSAPSN